ncbi:MAG: RpiB/LacA/LacB family sugar-phosphate isomerase [Candidatus Spechtbacterales bacterium]
MRATVYAARALDLELVKLMREHNNSNVLSLGARFVPEKDAKKVVKVSLETPFPGEDRHVRRIAKIDR